ncbi:hypothetical protein MTO96_040044 [Rhipicephalus appendiculatus]
MMCNVYAATARAHPELSTVAVRKKVSELSGVSVRAVSRIKAEAIRGPLLSPKRRRPVFKRGRSSKKTGRTRMQRYDSFTLGALRRQVHQYFMRNELPTSGKIAKYVSADPDMQEAGLRSCGKNRK